MKKRVALATRFFSYIAPAVRLYLRCAQVIFLACAKSDIATSSQLWNISNSPLAPKAHILILPLACGELLKCNFPFPHVFSLSSFPLCAMLEGTHDDRAAGDNTRHSHRRVPFSYYATALCAPGVANNTAQSLVLFVKFGAHRLAVLRLVFRLRRGKFRV